MISPLARQFLVAGSTHLAALSAGGMIAYPSVLLQQFKNNDTIIHLDLHNGSWIGSVHGIAGLPTILMPLLMQYRGRKLAFIISCVLITLGWFIMFLAQNITTLIIGECFHGLGGNSLVAVSFLSVSEMVQPKYRSVCITVYGLVQAFGMSIVGIIGQYLHWKTVGLILSCPILLALPIGLTWPESPSWLAWKGKYKECQHVFKRLRGTDEESRMELEAMVSKQLETKIKMTGMQRLREFRTTLVNRDFYLPALHSFVLINVTFWGGGMPVIIYSTDMIIKTSGRRNDRVKLAMDISFFVGFCVASILTRYCSAKKVLLCSMAGSSLFMMSASVVTYLQSVGTLPKDSELAVYCLAGFIALMSSGSFSGGFVISSEIMPVKHRGLGGCLFVIYTCICHTSSLKAYPYLSVYVNIWEVFLIYALYKMLSIIVIWKYVPETRHRTLQEIEEFYVYGYFKGVNKPKDVVKDDAVVVPFIKN